MNVVVRPDGCTCESYWQHGQWTTIKNPNCPIHNPKESKA